MLRSNPHAAPCGLLLLLLSACGTSTPEVTPSGADAPPSAEAPQVDLAALAIPNMSQPAPGVLCAGQLSVEQMDALAAGGYTRFVSLRKADESGSGWEEEHATAAGIDFVRLPIAGSADIDEAHARELATAMAGAEGPVVVYCGSSNRVGALLGLKAFHVDGLTAEDALEFGASAGATKLKGKLEESLKLGE